MFNILLPASERPIGAREENQDNSPNFSVAPSHEVAQVHRNKARDQNQSDIENVVSEI